MKFVADLHIHSKYSRATSRDMVLETLAPWAKVKGIGLLATGDFTHPEWLFLMKEKLEPMGNGFLRLKTGTTVIDAPPFRGLPVLGRPVAFILSSELSFIYSKGGKVRKVHVMVLAPDFESVERINRRLQAVGNLVSDGRPILGLDVRLFCRMFAEAAPRAVARPRPGADVHLEPDQLGRPVGPPVPGALLGPFPACCASPASGATRWAGSKMRTVMSV